MNQNITCFLLSTLLIASISCSQTGDSKDAEKENEEIIEEQLPDPLTAGWKGESDCEVMEENSKIKVLKCVFSPGVGHEKHYHDPHVGYTISGGLFKITDENGTREVDVKTGLSFSNESITSHEVQNIGKTTAEFLIIEYK